MKDVLVPFCATASEVQELQAIRDLRLSGQHYKGKKLEFFKRFRTKYGISSEILIKVETEDLKRLGKVQYRNNRPVLIPEYLATAV